MRGEDQGVAALEIFGAQPIFHDGADESALGMPEDESGAGELLNGVEIELLAEGAMVAALGLLKLAHVLVHLLFGVERGSVDALELGIAFLAEPVGSGDVEQLERLDFAGGWDVRAAAEIDELAGLVERNLFIGLGELLDEVTLHEIAFGLEALEAFVAVEDIAGVGLIALDDLLHLGLDLFEVFGGEGRLAQEVIEEAGLGGRTMTELGLREKLQHGGGQQVRRRVMKDLERFGILLGEQAKPGILLDGSGEIDHGKAIIERGASAALFAAPSETKGASLAARAASARRGEMDFAMSRAVVP